MLMLLSWARRLHHAASALAAGAAVPWAMLEEAQMPQTALRSSARCLDLDCFMFCAGARQEGPADARGVGAGRR